MDLLELIKGKAKYFSGVKDSSGIGSVVAHIETAERHLENGRKGDEYLFNDSVYRCNQAFEGALKEAYRTIAAKEIGRKTPYQIEEYFDGKSLFKPRVLNLFRNYRTEWRNKSTHDHTILFNEQEALLAVVSISAFINILFDQMIEKRAYLNEKKQLRNEPAIKEKKSNSKDLLSELVDVLRVYCEVYDGRETGPALFRSTSSVLIGSLSAFIESYDSSLNVLQEFKITGPGYGSVMGADILVERGGEQIMIEVKNPVENIHQLLTSGTEQLFNYMVPANISDGILFIPTVTKGVKVSRTEVVREIENAKHRVVQVYKK